MKHIVKQVIRHRGVTPLIAAQMVVKLLGVGGTVLLLGGAALGFYLGAENIKRKWNIAP